MNHYCNMPVTSKRRSWKWPASAGQGVIGGHAAPIFKQGASAPLGVIGGHAAPILTVTG